MFKMKGLTCASLAALIVALLIAARPLPANALPVITIYTEFPTYEIPAGSPVGTLFNVTVMLNSTEPFNLMMWQVYLYYNESLINITREPTYLRGWPNDNMGGKNWDPNYVFYGLSGGAIGNPTYYGPNVDGMSAIMLGDLMMSDQNISTFPRKLCTLELNVTMINGPLSCGLLINNENTFLYDSLGNVGATITDGTYTYVPEPILAILLAVMASSIGVTAVAKVKARKKLE